MCLDPLQEIPRVRPNRPAVVKLGGSVLTGLSSYIRCAQFLESRLGVDFDRAVVVVSAERGRTDRLAALAAQLCANLERSTLDLLWSTGELRSVALQTLALRARGLNAIALDVQQTGIIAGWRDPAALTVRTDILEDALSRAALAVVPGFFASRETSGVVSLGRGGSDLTAVLLAEALGVPTCTIVKDVPGYFVRDPHADPTAAHVPALTIGEALHLVDDGVSVVQRAALERAARSGVSILVRSFDEGQCTWVKAEHVSDHESSDGVLLGSVLPRAVLP